MKKANYKHTWMCANCAWASQIVRKYSTEESIIIITALIFGLTKYLQLLIDHSFCVVSPIHSKNGR